MCPGWIRLKNEDERKEIQALAVRLKKGSEILQILHGNGLRIAGIGDQCDRLSLYDFNCKSIYLPKKDRKFHLKWNREYPYYLSFYRGDKDKYFDCAREWRFWD